MTGDISPEIIVELRKLKNEIPVLETQDGKNPVFISWKKEAEILMSIIYRKDPARLMRFTTIKFYPVLASARADAFENAYREGLSAAGRVIDQALLEFCGKDMGESFEKDHPEYDEETAFDFFLDNFRFMGMILILIIVFTFLFPMIVK